MAFVAIAAAVLSAVSTIASAKAQSNAAKGEQNVANYNAQVAKNNAEATRQQAGANELAQRREAAIQLGRERAGIVQSGQGLDGSAADTYEQSLANAEIDAMNIRYMGDLKGQGLDSESTLQKARGVQYGKNAKAIMTAGYLSAGASALSSYGRYASGGTAGK